MFHLTLYTHPTSCTLSFFKSTASNFGCPNTLGCGPKPKSVTNLSGDRPWLSFPLSQQVAIAKSLLAESVNAHLPPTAMLGFCLAWVHTGLVYAVTTTGFWCSDMQMRLYVWTNLFPYSHMPPMILTVSLAHLPWWSLSLGERYMILMYRFGLSILKSLIFFILSSSWFSANYPFTEEKKSFSVVGWKMHQSMNPVIRNWLKSMTLPQNRDRFFLRV